VNGQQYGHRLWTCGPYGARPADRGRRYTISFAALERARARAIATLPVDNVSSEGNRFEKWKENVRDQGNGQQENRQDRGFGHGRVQQRGGHDVQRRPVLHDSRDHRLGVDIPVHSVLLCVHAVVGVHASNSHAVQVSGRPSLCPR